MKKVAGTFARKLERSSVHPPHYKPGAKLCSLEPKDKFVLFVRDTLEGNERLSAACQPLSGVLAELARDGEGFGGGHRRRIHPYDGVHFGDLQDLLHESLGARDE